MRHTSTTTSLLTFCAQHSSPHALEIFRESKSIPHTPPQNSLNMIGFGDDSTVDDTVPILPMYDPAYPQTTRSYSMDDVDWNLIFAVSLCMVLVCLYLTVTCDSFGN
jgi:hypothetical protein